MARLTGGFEKETSSRRTRSASLGARLGTGSVPGASAGGEVGGEEAAETKFKSRVESLPSMVVESCLQDMIQAAE